MREESVGGERGVGSLSENVEVERVELGTEGDFWCKS